jgi:hypothetical protein
MSYISFVVEKQLSYAIIKLFSSCACTGGRCDLELQQAGILSAAQYLRRCFLLLRFGWRSSIFLLLQSPFYQVVWRSPLLSGSLFPLFQPILLVSRCRVFVLFGASIFALTLLLPFSQWDTGVFAAVHACYHHVGFPSLLDADTTVYAWVDIGFAVSADEASVFFGETQFGAHCYFPRDFHVALSEFRVVVYYFFG